MSAGDFSGWIPGVLSKRQVKELISRGDIKGLNPKFIDHSSFDLTLKNEGYLMRRGAMKPSGDYEKFLVDLIQEKVAETLKADENGNYVLEKKHTYVFRLEQELGPKIRGSSFYGQATAKSLVGRVDVLARLIVDGMDIYEGFTPDGVKNGNGRLFLEITPITFPVLVKPGTSLSQLRLFFGKPENCEVTGQELHKSVLIDSQEDGCLSVNLEDVSLGSSIGCAFRARYDEANAPVPLWKDDSESRQKPDPKKYWNLERSEEIAGTMGLLRKNGQ